MSSPYDRNITQGTAYLAKQAITYINSIGMIIGIIATNLADVIFGGVMLGIVFQNIDILLGPPIDGWVLGFIASFAFWFIQLLMWQMIFEDNIVSKADIIPMVLALFVAVADTNIDISPVVLWIESSTIAPTLASITLFDNVTLYDFTLTSVIAGLYVVNGCSELFNAWYFGRMENNPFKRFKIGNKPKPKKVNQPPPQYKYKPVQGVKQ